jgi:hypothetical protein
MYIGAPPTKSLRIPNPNPNGDLTPFHPESNIDSLFPQDFPMLEPVCFLVEASYGGLVVIREPRSITGIVIMLDGTVIFAKTQIKQATC